MGSKRHWPIEIKAYDLPHFRCFAEYEKANDQILVVCGLKPLQYPSQYYTEQSGLRLSS
jgi:hypothetical protein